MACEHKYKTEYLVQRYGFGSSSDILIGARLHICQDCGQITHRTAVIWRYVLAHGIRLTKCSQNSKILATENAHSAPFLAEFRLGGE